MQSDECEGANDSGRPRGGEGRWVMGMCLEGRGDFACEVRRESIILHWENSGNSLCPVWPNDAPHVEFETRHLDDMIAALQQARRYLKKTALPARAQAIRADERAKVEREVVAYLYEQAPHWRDEDGESALMHAREVIAAGEHRPKPGQPKEGGK